ncbi:hypothetical protein PQR35_39300 [Paraburkholderia sediminicola]
MAAEVPEGVPLTVMGCVEGYSWCDVAAPDLRGWVYGGSLSYPYRGRECSGHDLRRADRAACRRVFGRFLLGASLPWPLVHDAARWANHPPPARGGPPPARGEVGRPPGPSRRSSAAGSVSGSAAAWSSARARPCSCDGCTANARRQPCGRAARRRSAQWRSTRRR